MGSLYEDNIIAKLGEISGMHKLLYLTLWSRADAIGVFHYNTDQILALTGIRYQRDDLDHFGDRVKWLNEKEVLLTRYLATTVKTLSVSNRNQNEVWRLIEQRWKATRLNPAPFYDEWRSMKIGIFAPPMNDEYTGEENLCPRVAKFRADLELCRTVDTPHGWSDKLAAAFKAFIKHRVDFCMTKTSKADTDKHRLIPSQVMTLQEIVGDMLADEVSEKKIIQQIRASITGNKTTIYTP